MTVVAVVATFVSISYIPAQDSKGAGITIYRADGTVREIAATNTAAWASYQASNTTRHCTSPARTTHAWVAASEPIVVTNTIREVVVQERVFVEPTYVVQPVYQPTYYGSGWYAETPRRVGGITFPFVASAGIGISTYPNSYYSGTYWQYDSRCQEYRNIAHTRAQYGGGGNPYVRQPQVRPPVYRGNQRHR